MPLEHNAVYTIHNDLTHTVLYLHDNFAEGWGWHGKHDQQWRLILVDQITNQWRLLNLGNERLLSLHATNNDERLRVDQPIEGAGARATFAIEPIQESSERYRIKSGASAVTLVTGQGVPGFDQAALFHDLHADGTPTALRGVPGDDEPIDSAQLWSFHQVAPLPVKDGTYTIVNSRTGLVLDVSGAGNELVRGLPRGANLNQNWNVTLDLGTNCYKFESSRVVGDNRFLSLGVVPPVDTTPLVAQVASNNFTVRKVPGTNLYKIFWERLAVNVGAPVDAAPVTLREVEMADMWAFE